MADKAISALPTATTLNTSDLFVLSQSNQAKNTTWQTIIGYLTTALNGHGGIQSIAKTGTSGLADTYTVTLADSTTYTFVVTNGKGISSIAKTGTSGLVDTYTITYNDSSTSTFTVDNGNGITSIVKTPAVPPSITDTYTVNYADGTDYTFTVDNGLSIDTIADYFGASPSDSSEPGSYSTTPPTLSSVNKYLWHYQTYTFNDGSTIETTHAVTGAYGDTGDASYVWIRYAAQQPTQDSDMKGSPDKWIGLYSGTSTTAPTSYTDYTWYQYKGDTGATGATGDYIDPVISYGTSTAAAVEPVTWYNDPSSISYTAGNFVWQKTEYTLHNAQTIQSVDKHIIGYIGQNGAGSGTVTQITFNGTVYADDGTGNVSISVDADDLGAIENPSTKSNGQVLTYDSNADEWVAANPATGNVNTVNNVGVTAGTTNIALYGTDIPLSSGDSTPVTSAIPSLPLSIANGGTGATTAAAAITALGLPLTATPSSGGGMLSVDSTWGLYPAGGISAPYTNDVLADALTLNTGAFFFRGNGSSYTGTVPDSNYKYGTFIVIRRNTTSASVIALPESTSIGIAYNTYSSGAWNGWQSVCPAGSVSTTITPTGFTVSDKVCYRQGSVVFFSFTAKLTTALSAGNTLSFTVSGLPSIPTSYIRARAIAGSAAVDVYIDSYGSGGIRNTGGVNISSGGTFFSISFTYITA